MELPKYLPPKPITDQESIDLPARRFSEYSLPKYDLDRIHYQRLQEDLSKFNPDDPHIDRIIEFYLSIHTE